MVNGKNMNRKTNNMLSKETAISLKAEIKKYSDTFNVADTQKYIKEVISEVSNDFIKNWLDKNMNSVVKEAVKEELQHIAKEGMKKK